MLRIGESTALGLGSSETWPAREVRGEDCSRVTKDAGLDETTG